MNILFSILLLCSVIIYQNVSHKTFLLRGNILHLVKKVIKLDIYIKEYFLVSLEHHHQMAHGGGGGESVQLFRVSKDS